MHGSQAAIRKPFRTADIIPCECSEPIKCAREGSPVTRRNALESTANVAGEGSLKKQELEKND